VEIECQLEAYAKHISKLRIIRSGIQNMAPRVDPRSCHARFDQEVRPTVFPSNAQAASSSLASLSHGVGTAKIIQRGAIVRRMLDRIEFLAQIAGEDGIEPFPLEVAVMKLYCHRSSYPFLELFRKYCNCVAALAGCMGWSNESGGV
jgi:hypothetical protein